MPPALQKQQSRPEPVSARRMVEILRQAKISHVLVVPDTVQRLFLSAVAEATDLTMVVAATEDEAMGINAGLYVTGHRPILSIQNTGLFACLNSLRGIALDGQVPTVMFIGLYGGNAETPPEANPSRMVRLLEPTLALWDVPVSRLWSDADLARFPDIYDEALTRRGPSALIVASETRE
jgi:sulfopyruvate decarboxylase TPP-binding subunit